LKKKKRISKKKDGVEFTPARSILTSIMECFNLPFVFSYKNEAPLLVDWFSGLTSRDDLQKHDRSFAVRAIARLSTRFAE
jgi:hypothetical protein